MRKINNLTIVLIAKNEADNLPFFLKNVQHFCPNLLVIDNLSTDETVNLALKAGAHVIKTKQTDFSQKRNLALEEVETEWLLYLDADERISPQLAAEIADFIDQNNNFIDQDTYVAGQFLRQNYFYGNKITGGGYQHDLVTRLFRKDKLLGWEGEIHESPIFQGEVHFFENYLHHLTHRSTAVNLAKSAAWTGMEAKLLVQNDPHLQPVTKLTLLRKGAAEFYRRYFRDHGRRDGMTGFVEALVQGLNRIMVYLQVWELQQTPSLETKYQKLEKKLAAEWK